MTLATVTPNEAAKLMREGAVLIDVREADERARAHIPGSHSLPLSKLEASELPEGVRTILYHCRSGARTQGNAPRLAEKAGACEAYIVEGGLNAWKQAGLPVVEDKSQPIEIMRQVQITAGSLTAFGTLMAALLSSWWLLLPAFVGLGLVYAGLSGTCAMARLLSYMPWNRPLRAATPDLATS